jgi:hypothetical protein
MKKILVLAGSLLVGMTAPAFASDRGDAVMGSVLGGVVGAVVGNGMGGQDGAVMGSVIGAAAGAYIAVDNDGHSHHRNDYYSGGGDRYYRGRDHYRADYCPPPRREVHYYPAYRDRYDRYVRYSRDDHDGRRGWNNDNHGGWRDHDRRDDDRHDNGHHWGERRR